MHIILHDSGTTITIIADNGNKVEVTCRGFINYCRRTDDGVTIWADGRPASETVRTDRYGNLLDARRRPIGERRPRKRGVKYSRR